MALTRSLTADELLYLPPPRGRAELVRGRLVVREPAGGQHGAVTNSLAFRLTAHVIEHRLGRVFAAETGFKIGSDPDTVRAADVAFVSRARLERSEPVGFPPLAPDLVVEVLSPGDRPRAVRAKVRDWLRAGTRLVWVLDPATMRVRVYRVDGTVSSLQPDGVLDGEGVVPGFRCALPDLG